MEKPRRAGPGGVRCLRSGLVRPRYPVPAREGMVVVVIEVIPMEAAPMPKRVAVATVIRPEMGARWVTRKPRSIWPPA